MEAVKYLQSVRTQVRVTVVAVITDSTYHGVVQERSAVGHVLLDLKDF